MGSLGIGISSPLSRLHIKDGQSWGSDLSIDATGLAGGRRYLLISTGGTASEGQGKFLIKDNNANAVRLTIDPSGNLGIGITNPTVKLEIAGDIKSSGNIIVKDSSNNFDSLFNGGIIKEKFLPYCKEEITSDVYTNSQNQSTGCNFGGYSGYYNIENLTPENVKAGVSFGRGQTGTYSVVGCGGECNLPACDSFYADAPKGAILHCNTAKKDCCTELTGLSLPEKYRQCNVCTKQSCYPSWSGSTCSCICGITYYTGLGNCSIGYWGGSYCVSGVAFGSCLLCQVK